MASSELGRELFLGGQNGQGVEDWRSDRLAIERGRECRPRRAEADLVGKIKGHEVAASENNPEFLVPSDKSGKVAAHKPSALRRVK
jgi:Hypervirulence associated proteins TUDOR domain